MDKAYCHLCGKEIVFDCIEPLPLTWHLDGKVVYYCGEHAEIGQEIFDRFFSERNKLNEIEGYCDEEKLLYKIESQYKTNCGDWNIQFPNLHQRGAELVGAPILREGKPIGFITEVDDEYVKGRIWSRCIPIVEEGTSGDQHVMSFELVC